MEYSLLCDAIWMHSNIIDLREWLSYSRLWLDVAICGISCLFSYGGLSSCDQAIATLMMHFIWIMIKKITNMVIWHMGHIILYQLFLVVCIWYMKFYYILLLLILPPYAYYMQTKTVFNASWLSYLELKDSIGNGGINANRCWGNIGFSNWEVATII